MTLLDARGLVKYFPVTAGLLRRRVGDVKAVDGVSLAIEEGTTLALVGETGSGKTTLGRLLTRLLTPTNGQIVFEGRDITGLDEQALRPVRRQMQMVFQNPASSLNPRRRVKEIIEEPLVVHGIGTPVARLRQVRELLERVALPPRDFLFRYPHALSGGQRQRVAIARALVTNPSIILADEPTGNLDSKTGEEIMMLFEELHRQGNTIILVTHEADIAEHARRAIRLRDGKVASDEANAHGRGHSAVTTS